jgi:hypothetical protein
MLGNSLTVVHKDKRPFRGGININNVWYFPDDNALKIIKEVEHILDQIGFIGDTFSLLSILDQVLVYHDLQGNKRVYPIPCTLKK